ncbi:MAG: type II secretion system minor pseudopilin GspI [Rhodospirillaceae bacterium]|nr:type II secretion system minor pseudopilin GspI [Rhodospirillaceae bacterium]
MSRRSPRPAARGFTLIEVLVALSILSIGVLAAFKLVRESTLALGGVRERVMADIVADNTLIETLAQPQPPVVTMTRGEVDMAGARWTWRRTVTPTSDPDLLRIDIEVGRGDASGALARVTGFRGTH